MMNNSFEEVRKLLTRHVSRSYTDLQVNMILQKPELFDHYIACWLLHEQPVSRFAAWVITHAVQLSPDLAASHLNQLIEHAPLMNHDGEKRSLAKIFTLIPLPQNLYGEILDLCFEWMSDNHEAIATRAYCMETLLILSREFPEIRGEMIAVIENNIDFFSAGLKNKGMKVLKQLHAGDKKPGRY
jgi:hypothetical protein